MTQVVSKAVCVLVNPLAQIWSCQSVCLTDEWHCGKQAEQDDRHQRGQL